MTCDCQSLDDTFYMDEAPRGFQTNLEQRDTANWMRLFSCIFCQSLWAIDEWDKYQEQVVFRVRHSDSWFDVGAAERRKSLLLRSRGGEVSAECICACCQKPRIRGVVYCLDHLYENGARR
jgi:hypothetical protein